MRINKGKKLGAALAGIVFGVIGIIAALATLGTSTASATTGNTGACTGCHTLQDGSLRITTDTTTKSVATGASFAVSISWTGGGGSRTEINWPNTASNTQFTPTPRVPYSGPNASGTTSSTLTAPATAGTYAIRVYAGQKSPALETDYKEMTITVVAPATYTLTYTAGANGSVTGTSPQTVASGAGGTAVTATPASGYHFVSWSDGSTANPRTDSAVTASISVTATFAINTYTITPTAGANGSISPATTVTVNSGASRAFTITPAAGYHVVNVLIDGSSVGAVTSYTFTNVTAAHAISATFAINTYTITPTAGANGSISPATTVTVNSGASQVFTITPAAGYHVVSVLIDGSSVGAVTSHTFTNVTANRTISVTFGANAVTTYTLTYTAGANGSIIGTSPQTVASGAGGTAVTATPASGYHFVSWSDGSTANPRTDSAVTASISVTATFAINTYTITPTAGANGSISPATTVTVNSGASQVFTITPAAGYHVVSVLIDGSSVGAVTSHTFTNVTANRTISVTFGANAVTTYTLTYTAGANGSIIGTSPQTVASGAGGTAVTATPASGYHFVSWSDGSTANPRTDSAVTASVSVTATFAINTHTLTPVAAANGSISPSGTVTVAHAADQGFTITANSGYHITGVLVDGAPVATAQATLVAAPEIAVTTYTFTNVTASHTISAAFAPNAIVGSDTTGPLTSGSRLSIGRSNRGSVTLNAVVNDTTTGGSSVAAAEYFLDVVGPNGSGAAMGASDGRFNAAREAVRATLKVAGLSAGGHTVYVRGRDAAGNWGATARLYFQVRTNRRMSAGEIRLVQPDDDSRSSSSTIVVWIGTGRQQEHEDDD